MWAQVRPDPQREPIGLLQQVFIVQMTFPLHIHSIKLRHDNFAQTTGEKWNDGVLHLT